MLVRAATLARAASAALLVAALGALCPADADAQVPRLGAERTAVPRYYADVRLSLGYYGGERLGNYGGPIQEFTETSRTGFGFEFGRSVGRRLTAGAFYHATRFPVLLEPAPGRSFDPVVAGASSDWLHLVGVLARWRPVTYGPASLTVQGGMGGAFTLLNDAVRVGLAPRVGAGAEVRVPGGFEVFLEADGLFAIPDRAVDLASGDASHDLFTFLTFGGRYRFGTLFGAARPQLLGVQGPAALAAGEPGYYAADVETGGRDASYTWTFGDGTTSEERLATHTYAAPGTYTVTFEARIGDAVLTETLTTVVTAPSLPPAVAVVRTAPEVPRAREPVRFEPTLEGTPPFTCVWDFGDGATAIGCAPEHTYAEVDTFTVGLTVVSAAGQATWTEALAVEPNLCLDPPALADVYFEPNSSELSVYARAVLRTNLDVVAGCPSATLRVVGYSTPGERNESALSAARAEAVTMYYRSYGIAEARLEAVGGGRHPELETGVTEWQYRTANSVLVPAVPGDAAPGASPDESAGEAPDASTGR